MRLQHLLATTTAVAVLAACSPNSGDDDTITLEMWSWQSSNEEVFEGLFEAYENTHPGVEIDFRPYTATEYDTILSTGLAGDEGPDLAMLRPGAGIQPLIQAGQLVELTTQTVPGLRDFAEASLRSAQSAADQQTYGVPFAIQTLQIFYNQQIFREHNISEPTTWAELITAAQRLREADLIPFAIGGRDSGLLATTSAVLGATRWGGDTFTDAVLTGDRDFTDPAFVAGVDLLNQLEPYFPDNHTDVSYTDAQTLFTSGRAAMYPAGLWEVANFRRNAQSLEVGVFLAPPAPGAVSTNPMITWFADGSYGVSARTPHRTEAMEFVAWLATPEFGQAFTDRSMQLSPVPGVTPTDPLLQEIVNLQRGNSARYFLNDFAQGTPPSATVYRTALQEMLLGRIDARQACRRMQDSVATWHRPR